MFKQKSNRREGGIMSLAVVFVIGFLGLGMMTTISTIALSEINKNINTKSGNQTFYTAEAAAREGIYQYLSYDATSGNFVVPINNIATDSITFLTSTSSRGWAYREVEGNAENNLTNRTVKSTLLLFPSAAAFNHAIYSENDLSITGSVDISGNVFSNGTTTCAGSSNIDGESYSVGVDNCGTHASHSEGDVDIIPPPVIDPYSYSDIANCTSTLADVGNDCLSGPTAGVVFVDDPLAPPPTEVLNGIDLVGNLTIIGNIKITGGEIVSSNDYPALIVNGDLTLGGGVEITGIVYVSGNTAFSAGTTKITGSLISIEGVVDLGGNVTIDYDMPSAPPGGFATSGVPKIVSWQEQ